MEGGDILSSRRGVIIKPFLFFFFLGKVGVAAEDEIGCNGLSERHNAETVNPPTRKEKLSALFAPQPRNMLMMFSFFSDSSVSRLSPPHFLLQPPFLPLAGHKNQKLSSLPTPFSSHTAKGKGGAISNFCRTNIYIGWVFEGGGEGCETGAPRKEEKKVAYSFPRPPIEEREE